MIMPIIRFAGGLGNQIFQLAFAVYYIKKFKIGKIGFVNATDHYEVQRTFQIDQLFDLSQLGLVHQTGIVSTLAVNKLRVGKWPLLGVSDRSFESYGLFLDGYFQDSWDSTSIASVFELLANSLVSPTLCQDRFENALVVHVRGGDFKHLPDFNICNKSFYLNSIKLMQDKYQVEDVILVTDDMVHAETLLAGIPYSVYSSDQGALGDFDILRRARYRVIGNSTFALSACLLNSDTSYTLAHSKFDLNRNRNWVLFNEFG